MIVALKQIEKKIFFYKLEIVEINDRIHLWSLIIIIIIIIIIIK